MSKKNGALGLSDVQNAQNGENKNLFLAEPMYIEPVNEEVVVMESENIIFRLKDNDRNGAIYIDCEDYVVNPTTGKMDSIHLLIGEDEIWGSELKKKYPTNFSDIVKTQKRISLKFASRSLIVPSWDKPAVEFLRNHRGCIDSKHNKQKGRVLFYEYNPMREAELADYKMAKEMEAMEVLFTLDEQRIKKLSIYLNIPLVDVLGESKPIKLLKRDLAIKLKGEPENFLRLVKDESVDINYLVLKAIKDSKIDVSQVAVTGNIYWATGSFICAVNSLKPKEALVQLALSKTPDGNVFAETLKTIVK